MKTDLPRPGLDTAVLEDGTCIEAVSDALDIGYRHIDTAQLHGNEETVGEAIAKSEIEPEALFLAAKVAPENLGYEDVLESTEESLERLGVDAVDLLYVHRPTDAYDPEETLPAFDEVRDRGLTRHVGVSHFTVDLLEEAIDVLDAPVFANQVELHPWLQQDELVSVAREHDIWTVAHTPVMQGMIVNVGVLQSIGSNHRVTPAQATLAWHHGRDGVVPLIPARDGRLEKRYQALDATLTANDRERIAGLDRGYRFVNFADAPWN